MNNLKTAIRNHQQRVVFFHQQNYNYQQQNQLKQYQLEREQEDQIDDEEDLWD